MITIVIISNDHHCNALSSSLPVVVITIIIISLNDWSWFSGTYWTVLKSSCFFFVIDFNNSGCQLHVDWFICACRACEIQLWLASTWSYGCNSKTQMSKRRRYPDNWTFPSITVTQMRHHVAVYYYWSMIMFFKRGRFWQMNAFNWGRW